VVECIFNCLGYFESSLFPVTDRNKYLKTEILVGGQDNRIDLEEVNKDPDEFFNPIMLNKKFGMSIKL
jgi:hypothetical protein